MTRRTQGSRSQRGALPLLALGVLALSACGPQFRNVRIQSATFDAAEKATRVRLAFEVWDGEEQLQGLTRSAFRVHEDGQLASNESLADTTSVVVKAPVVLVLDTSFSMYLAKAIGPLKSAARAFEQRLTKEGFDVRTWAFAASVRPIASLDEIPDHFTEGQGSERWTSLYAATAQAFTRHPDAVYVVFSDGADNYSQNHGITSFEVLKGRIEAEHRVVHAIAFGNVRDEVDRNGLNAATALEELAANGSFHFAASAEAFATVFADVASRIRRPYIFDYLSPNLSGQHSLELELRHPRGDARADPVPFVAGGVPAGLTATILADGELLFQGPSDEVAAAWSTARLCLTASEEHLADTACRTALLVGSPGVQATVKLYLRRLCATGAAGTGRFTARPRALCAELVR